MRRQLVGLAMFAILVTSCGRTMPPREEQSFDKNARAALQSLERREYARLFAMFCYPDAASRRAMKNG